MISAVAFCLQPPLLLPALTVGAANELADLRAVCTVAGPYRVSYVVAGWRTGG